MGCEKKLERKAEKNMFSLPTIHFLITPPVSLFLLVSVRNHSELKSRTFEEKN